MNQTRNKIGNTNKVNLAKELIASDFFRLVAGKFLYLRDIKQLRLVCKSFRTAFFQYELFTLNINLRNIETLPKFPTLYPPLTPVSKNVNPLVPKILPVKTVINSLEDLQTTLQDTRMKLKGMIFDGSSKKELLAILQALPPSTEYLEIAVNLVSLLDLRPYPQLTSIKIKSLLPGSSLLLPKEVKIFEVVNFHANANLDLSAYPHLTTVRVGPLNCQIRLPKVVKIFSCGEVRTTLDLREYTELTSVKTGSISDRILLPPKIRFFQTQDILKHHILDLSPYHHLKLVRVRDILGGSLIVPKALQSQDAVKCSAIIRGKIVWK